MDLLSEFWLVKFRVVDFLQRTFGCNDSYGGGAVVASSLLTSSQWWWVQLLPETAVLHFAISGMPYQITSAWCLVRTRDVRNFPFNVPHFCPPPETGMEKANQDP